MLIGLGKVVRSKTDIKLSTVKQATCRHIKVSRYAVAGHLVGLHHKSSPGIYHVTESEFAPIHAFLGICSLETGRNTEIAVKRMYVRIDRACIVGDDGILTYITNNASAIYS